ncbi:ester cyclase [Amycolatopsis sp. CA-230715]|uniref:ester cyclase n=1 Tax=Amycolatopsis sp. CA-230715 TaxID=2745196 RepID=UPI001C009C67|nr:nuclear transport factor 2 family protein [Amycolatopsis sp. CA-230715]QWF80593.1 hypothetical protein HUW46_04016 [Amycolatopsis sp. CA-230715]
MHELYRRWLDELWNGDPSAANDLVTADFAGHWPDREVRGPGELAELIHGTHEMFDDLAFELTVGPIADGELVAGRWVGRGTTKDGEPATFLGNDILRVRDGRFAEYWVASLPV